MAVRKIDMFASPSIDRWNRKRVINWLMEYIRNNTILKTRYVRAVKLTKQKKIKEAITEIKEMLKLLALDGSDPRGYIVGHELREQGFNTTAIIFFKYSISNIRNIPKEIPQSRVTKEEKKESQNLKKYFSNVEGKRREGIIEPVLSDGKISYRFVDKETRKYIPQTKKVKEEIERLKAL